ncbi:hypothetical protein BDV97DRAFT_375919 [Delphinella strobiligena]|nr:hypothetical protein BDV97DRAFT_375919 [Delphinella strobiligena]
MSSPNPPPEDPEYTSEPKVLSPVSPKPLHYPTPHNIPILEKQIDQAFNQTSAHMAQAAVQQQQQQQQQPTRQAQAFDQINSGAEVPPPSVAAHSIPYHVEAQPSQASEADGDNQGQAQDEQTNSPMNYAPHDNAPGGSNVASAHSETTSAQASTAPTPPSSEHNPVDAHPSSAHANVPAPAPAQSLDAAQSDIPEAQAQAQGVTVEASNAPTRVDNNTNGVQFHANVQHLLANFSHSNLPQSTLPQSNLPQSNLPQSNLPNASAPPAQGTDFAPASLDNLNDAVQPAPGTVSSTTAASGGAPPGLPPKPPAQEQPSIHPNYNASTDIRAYHPHNQHVESQPYIQQSPAYYPNAQLPAFAPAPGQSAAPGVSSLPPPPIASFQQQQPVQLLMPQSESPNSQANRQRELESQREIKQAAGEVLDDADVPWTPETQRKYDVFLNEERKYVTEGNWEQFPHGSRLFVGNLSSERVTKRDIFHVFHRYGHLAQISIKQAYGFVQYLQTDACARAMQVEQGKVIRGKKIHLEVSKPQKNRNTNTKGSRRSRSPNPPVDRYQPGQQNRRNDDRNRRSGRGGRESRDDQYRPHARSPSPPSRYRSRDRSRDRYDGRYRSRSRSRSRSPYARNGARYRSPSPRRSDDDDLPLPRRRPGEIPDVQIIALDAPDRDFISYIERAFTARGIRVDVLFLSPRLSLDAVIKRQALEGVVAVSKLTRLNQVTVKIPLQLFDRKIPSDVRFDEYQDLDPNVAAELVIRAKAQAVPAYQPPTFPPPIQYGYGGLPQPPLPLPPQMSQVTVPPAQPNLSNLITSLDPTGLQKLLGAMQPQTPHHPQQPHSATGMTSDLAKLLGNASAAIAPPPPLPLHQQQSQQQSHMTFGQHGAFPPPPPPQNMNGTNNDPLAALRANPALAGLLGQVGQSGTPMQGVQMGNQPMPPQHSPHVSTQQRQGQQQSQQPPGGYDMAEILARLGNHGQR